MPRATVVLSDRIHLPTSERTRALLLVAAGALLTALSAQISFVLPWTPVPVTGQTFAVLVVGASLGWRLDAGSQLLYVAPGPPGLPAHAHGTGASALPASSPAGYPRSLPPPPPLGRALAPLHQTTTPH